jgi:hypothetical protein
MQLAWLMHGLAEQKQQPQVLSAIVEDMPMCGRHWAAGMRGDVSLHTHLEVHRRDPGDGCVMES